ncbi:pyridoxal-phosphate dependent enzyme [Streptomyces sp. P38-E01]|uniref:Pyridoxal-phosphate dependent enzyme n=1 Tax=Streptomyces tardus TaxID=2780544 RepID=A0A949N349_9ACTN|nr:pyridoxal-phosphate dependent enzyme [Streptomyces tardus]MBU7596479.1 pyridoxal-phosphate dependent enzyme [Streptomyces tardus]
MLPQLHALDPRLPSPLQEVRDERFDGRGLRLLLKRDDLIHPELSGNKWRKLAPNLRTALTERRSALLTFGGAYSNHLRATAAAGRLLGLPTIGVVRGQELADRPLNPVLARCREHGMRLHFVTRAEYRDRATPELTARLRGLFGRDVLVVPEGGSNAAAVHGCTALGAELRGQADLAAVACGTGGTLAGMAATGPPSLGFPVLRGDFLTSEVSGLQQAAFGAPRGDWRLVEGFHCGGYARTTPELLAYAEDFEQRHGIALERVYVAKMLLGLTALAEAGRFAPGTALAAVVTGAPPPEPPAPPEPPSR